MKTPRSKRTGIFLRNSWHDEIRIFSLTKSMYLALEYYWKPRMRYENFHVSLTFKGYIL